MNFSNSTLPLVPANGDMSQTTVWAGPIDNRFRRFTAVSAIYTGAPVGTLQLMGTTLVPAPSLVAGPGWQAMGSAVAVSAAGNYLWDVVDTGCIWLAVFYTKTSGTGTLAVTQSAKE